jgi:hypothetical protein
MSRKTKANPKPFERPMPRTIIATTEQVMCPNPDCDTRLGAHDYKSSPITEHAERSTVRREIKTHCPNCDRRYTAELYLQGGSWLIESLTETPRKQRRAA